MPDVFGIQPDHAGLERIRNPQRAAHIRGPDVAGEAILHGVGDLDGVILVAERDHGEERTEHFLLRDAHLGVRAGDECWLHIMPAAGAVMRLCAPPDDSATLPPDLEKKAKIFQMALGRQDAAYPAAGSPLKGPAAGPRTEK